MNHVIRDVILNVTDGRSVVTFASCIFHYDYCNKSFLQFTLKVSKERFSQSVFLGTIFLNVCPPKEDIFLTTIYGLAPPL